MVRVDIAGELGGQNGLSGFAEGEGSGANRAHMSTSVGVLA